MWFYLLNGDLNKIFEDFYRNISDSKMIFFAFRNLNIYKAPGIRKYIECAFENEADKDYFSMLHFVGTEGLKIYLYKSLYCMLYSEYEFFVKELIQYFKEWSECKKYNPTNEKFNYYKNCLLKEVNDKNITSIIAQIDNCRIVRNNIIHNNSYINEEMGCESRNKIEKVLEICREIEPLEIIEISEDELIDLYTILEKFLNELKECFMRNPQKFRIRSEESLRKI